MTRILVRMSETIPLTEARTHFSELLDRVEKEQQRIVITRNGRPVAVLLHPDDLEGLEETLEILSQPGALEEIRQAEQEADEGKGIPLEDVLKEFQ